MGGGCAVARGRGARDQDSQPRAGADPRQRAHGRGGHRRGRRARADRAARARCERRDRRHEQSAVGDARGPARRAAGDRGGVARERPVFSVARSRLRIPQPADGADQARRARAAREPCAERGHGRIRVDGHGRAPGGRRARRALLVAQYPRAGALRRRNRIDRGRRHSSVHRNIAAFDPAHVREADAHGDEARRHGAADAQAPAGRRADAAPDDRLRARARRAYRSRPLRARYAARRATDLSVAARALLARSEPRRLRSRQSPPRASAARLPAARACVRVGEPARSRARADARRSRRRRRRHVSRRGLCRDGARRRVRVLRHIGLRARESRDSRARRVSAATGEAVSLHDRAAHRVVQDRDARADVPMRLGSRMSSAGCSRAAIRSMRPAPRHPRRSHASTRSPRRTPTRCTTAQPRSASHTAPHFAGCARCGSRGTRRSPTSRRHPHAATPLGLPRTCCIRR